MADIANRNRRSALIVALIALAMLGLGYASVPLYRVFCAATGLNGTTGRATAADLPLKVSSSTVQVRFDSNVSPKLPWSFHPEHPVTTVELGERKMVFFIAQNNSNRTITGRATFNVTPNLAGLYFKKIQCFCFTAQTLKPGERVRMPVIFFVDPAILKDEEAKQIQEITLSYTFYPVDEAG